MRRQIALPLFFFALGFCFTLFISLGFVRHNNCDLSMLINVGKKAGLRPIVEADFGPVCLVDDVGHDGTFTYLVARDPGIKTPLAQIIQKLGDSPTYRYRRILYSALGGLFGTLGPQATLFGLLFFGAVGVGLATGAAAYLCERVHASAFCLLGVLVNPGLYSSLTTLTADHLAFGLSVAALVSFSCEAVLLSSILCALAALTKDQHILVSVSLAVILMRRGQRLDSIRFIGAASLPLLLWMAYIRQHVPEQPLVELAGHLAIPFMGFIAAAEYWPRETAQDQIFHLGVFFALGACMWRIIRERQFEYLCLTLPWIVLLLSAGSLVWDIGNNIARACIFLYFLAFLPQTTFEGKSGSR